MALRTLQIATTERPKVSTLKRISTQLVEGNLLGCAKAQERTEARREATLSVRQLASYAATLEAGIRLLERLLKDFV